MKENQITRGCVAKLRTECLHPVGILEFICPPIHSERCPLLHCSLPLCCTSFREQSCIIKSVQELLWLSHRIRLHGSYLAYCCLHFRHLLGLESIYLLWDFASFSMFVCWYPSQILRVPWMLQPSFLSVCFSKCLNSVGACLLTHCGINRADGGFVLCFLSKEYKLLRRNLSFIVLYECLQKATSNFYLKCYLKILIEPSMVVYIYNPRTQRLR